MTVESIGRGRGLALLWMNDAKVKVRSFFKNHIDVMIGEAEKERRWRFTSFYDDPDTSMH